MSAARRILPLFIPHLGCPHACVFCDQKRISGAKMPVTAAEITAALEALRPEERGIELAFYGGSFTALPISLQRELLGAVQPFRENGTVSSIRLSTRPDAVCDGIPELLAAFGVETVELGAQSMCDEVLERCGRGHRAEDTVRASALLRQRGFHLILQMMTGLPGTTPEMDILTARQLAALHPDGVRIYPTVILRDTQLCELWRSGAYREHTVEDAVCVCAAILPIFDEAGIRVIRLGLNPSAELSGGAAVGGAYHPALGELVRSRVFRNRAEALLSAADRDADAVFAVSPGCVSQAVGQHRCNLLYLCEKFSLRSLKFLPQDSVPAGELRRMQ